MLLVVMLCVVMAFGAASVPASAEVIEVEKPAKPREVSVESINSSKKAYHTNDDIEFVIKFKDLTKEDIKNIKSCVIHIKELFTDDFDLDFPIIATYDKTINGFTGIINKKTELKETDYILKVEYTMCFLYKDSNNRIKIKEDSYNRKRITFTVNNNCADGNHTIYKNNWEIIKPATCTASGEKVIKCNICNQIVESENIPMIPHKASVAPKVISEGNKKYIIYRCSCGKILNKELFSQEAPKPQKKQKIHTTKIKFYKKSITIKKRKTIKLKYIRKPVNAQDILIWKSSNPKVVKIMKNGKIKGLKRGRAIITVRTITGKRSKIIVKVK